jgi:hypothetical protein
VSTNVHLERIRIYRECRSRLIKSNVAITACANHKDSLPSFLRHSCQARYSIPTSANPLHDASVKPGI